MCLVPILFHAVKWKAGIIPVRKVYAAVYVRATKKKHIEDRENAAIFFFIDKLRTD